MPNKFAGSLNLEANSRYWRASPKHKIRNSIGIIEHKSEGLAHGRALEHRVR